MDPTDMVNLAKEETANYVSRTIAGDPAAIASSVAGALGDRLLFGAVTGHAAKGALKGAFKGSVTEGVTEGIENAGQTYATNTAMNTVTGTERDPWGGALQSAAEGAAVGMGIGAVSGGIGGLRGKNSHTKEASPTDSNTLVQEPSSTQDESQPYTEDVDISENERQPDVPESPSKTMQDSFVQGIGESRDQLKEKGVLSAADRRETMYLARAYNPERAAQIEKELSDPDVYNDPDYSVALADEYQQLAQSAKNLDVDPLATAVDRHVTNHKRDLKTRNQQLKESSEIAKPQSPPPNLSSQQAEYDQIREQVVSQLLSEDQNNQALIDRLTQIRYDKIHNDAPVEHGQPHRPQPYIDKGAAFNKKKSQAAIDDKAIQAREAALHFQAENERSQRPQFTPNPNWIGDIDGAPVTRTYQREQANTAAREQQARQDKTDLKKDQIRNRMGRDTSGRFQQFNNDAERIQSDMPTKSEVQDIKHQATERQLERSFSESKITGMSKRLRRRIQRSKGFDTEAVLNEFRHHEKRLQAYQEEARQQAEREASDPENIRRRKSAQALFEEKIASPEAKQFKENLIQEAIRRVNASLDKTSGTVLEIDSRSKSLPEVKKQLTNSVRSLANQFIGKTAALNEKLRAKSAENESRSSSDAESAPAEHDITSLEAVIPESSPVAANQPETEVREDEYDTLSKAKALIEKTLQSNRESTGKASLKGIRTVYRNEGIMAKALNERVKKHGYNNLSDFERKIKAASEGKEPSEPEAQSQQASPQTERQSEEEPQPEVSENIQLLEAMQTRIQSGFKPSNNLALKRAGKDIYELGSISDVTPLMMKKLQEAYETAQINQRRLKVNKALEQDSSPQSVERIFNQLTEDYQAQPKLNIRTAHSSDLQAYSTPAPLSFLGNIVAGIDADTTVLEPTAGNGLLLMTSAPENTFANELDPVRAESLRWSGFDVTTLDANGDPLTNGMVTETVDRVIANPPFGKIRGEKGEPEKFSFEDRFGNIIQLGELDHVIARNALQAMKSDGKAYLILGTSKVVGKLSVNQRIFLNWLHQNYHVRDYTEIDGKLYEKQGAGWPVMLISIDGRAKTPTGQFAPTKSRITRHQTWDSLYEHYRKQGLLGTQSSRYGRRTTDPAQVSGKQRAEAVLRADAQRTQRKAGIHHRDGNERRTKRSGHFAGSPPADQSTIAARDVRLDTGRLIHRTAGKILGSRELSTENSADPAGWTKKDTGSDKSHQPAQPLDENEIKTAPDSKRANAFQSVYRSKSGGLNDSVLTPANIEYYTSEALSDLEARHGNIDTYVMDKLGYPSISELHDAFMGLQTDAVGLAVSAIENNKAIIIGDQTGVGKGRQAAGILRYAMNAGKTPIFITQKDNLFTDMVDDLADIGVRQFTPLIMNRGVGIKQVISSGTPQEKTVFRHRNSGKTLKKYFAEMNETGRLPDGFDALFATYDQISTDQRGIKKSVLNALAKNAVLVMDEAHSAASGEKAKSNRGLFFNQYVGKVAGLTYLSATYAKRPENMALYRRTDLGVAAGGDDVTGAIETGGLGMQNYIAAKLAQAGHYIRRERSFDGIEIKDEIISSGGDIERAFDTTTAALRGLQRLSRAWDDYVQEELAESIAAEHGLDTLTGGNKADKNINVNSFSSVVHNYIAQLTLGLKADAIAELAIASSGRGEKPVIALESTLGSALKNYMADNNLSDGDSLGSLSYADYLGRTLDNVLAYRVKAPGEKNSEKFTVSIDDIDSPLLKHLYDQAKAAIVEIAHYNIPASPIDHIRHRLEQAGLRVAEITGRKRMVDYDSRKIIPRATAEANDRRGQVDQFNAGTLDVLILNQAGSTGLSIHSRDDYPDTRQRFMIVAQPSLNIDTYMQMLGRVNRTGQVNVPKYANAWLDLPSEKRPAAVLAGKMASLNANTSGSTESATSVKSFDLLNPYGDAVVIQYVKENLKALGEYGDDFVKVSEADQPANYFLGKLAVLPVALQRDVLAELDTLYAEKINYLNATGQNYLNMTEIDLQAEPVEQTQLVAGDPKRGVFSEPVYLTRIRAKMQGKAPHWDEVQERLSQSSEATFKSLAHQVKVQANEFYDQMQGKVESLNQLIETHRAKGKSVKSLVSEKNEMTSALAAYKHRIGSYERWVSGAYGQFVRVKFNPEETDSPSVMGVVVGVNHASQSGDPMAPSKTRIEVMVADQTRHISFTYRHIHDGTLTQAGNEMDESQMQMIFDHQASLPSVENRYVMTGNLIMAKDQTIKAGQIVPFTTHDGRVIQGMLLPRSFEPKTHIKASVDATAEQSLDWLMNTRDNELASLGLSTKQHDVYLRRDSRGAEVTYVLQMPKSVSRGKRFWGNPEIEAIIGEQAVSGSGILSVGVKPSDLSVLVNAFEKIAPLRPISKAQIDDFMRLNQIEQPKTSSSEIVFSKASIATRTPAKGMSLKSAELAVSQWLKAYQGGAGVKVTVVPTQAAAEKIAGMNFGQRVIYSFYRRDSREVVVIAENLESAKQLRQKLRHEILVHHSLKTVVGAAEYQSILRRVRQGRNSPYLKALWESVDRNYRGQSDSDLVEEVLARAAEIDRNKIRQWWDRVVEAIAHALRKVGLMKASDVTVAELNNIVQMLADRVRMANNPYLKAADSRTSTSSGIQFSQEKNMTLDEALAQSTPQARFGGVLNAVSQGLGAVRGNLGLGALTLRQLADLSQRKLPQLSEYVDTVHRMLSRRNQLAFDAHEMANSIRKWMGRHKQDADEMFDIAHQSTIEGVDPAQAFQSAREVAEKRIQHLEYVNDGSHKTNEQMDELKTLRNMLAGEPRRMKKHAELKQRFDKLPEEAKQHYRTMRDTYRERHDLFKHLLEQQIINAAIDGRIKKARLADLRAQFELQEVMAPYFPLARFGDYWLSTTDENGEKRYMMYESEREQQVAKKKLERQGFSVFTGYKLDKNQHIEGASLGFVVDLVGQVEESSLNDLKKTELQDMIYQMYLQSLPSRSMRKQFMHRQKVKGWSNDALRALAENMVKGSYQLARLEYADELTKLATETIETAKQSGDNQSSRYANELMKRHEWVMYPKHSKAAQKITSLGFLYMLGFSPAAAAVNITQNFVVALPMIASKFGAIRASSELAKATKEFISAKGNIKSKLKDAGEIAAFNQWYDSGLLDSTNAHDLAGMAEGQSWKYSPAYEKFSGWMSALFHKAEVFNRETTALATYRLARKKGMSHDQSAKLAEKLTWDAHFDYSNVNRARYMQSPVMKVATQFKQYSQNMTYYLMRNAFLSMKGMTSEERSEARKQLVGTLGMTALLGGVSALPLSLVYGLANSLNAAFGDDDEPWEAETEFKTYLSDVLGENIANKIIYGVGGAGMSPRISLDGMWIRDPNRDLEGDNVWSFYAQQVAGPVLGGVAVQAIRSGDKALHGDYYRSIEGLVPVAVKNVMKAYRYADEGALNSRGDAYKEDFDVFEILEQLVGMTPGDLSKQYQLNNARKNYEQHVLDRRSNLMKSYYLAWKLGDERLMLKTQQAIAHFNRRYPPLALTSKSIRQSIRVRQRYSRESAHGVNLNQHLRGVEADVVW
ncbi:PLxRFG domain-containing protein [Vibrio ruber]|nr:PLxRFG domain-containing protein [Vibrio ruber]